MGEILRRLQHLPTIYFSTTQNDEVFCPVCQLKTTLGSVYNQEKDGKETACYKWVLVATELINIAVNDFDFDAKKSAH